MTQTVNDRAVERSRSPGFVVARALQDEVLIGIATAQVGGFSGLEGRAQRFIAY